MSSLHYSSEIYFFEGIFINFMINIKVLIHIYILIHTSFLYLAYLSSVYIFHFQHKCNSPIKLQMLTIKVAILNPILFFNFYFKRPSNKLRTQNEEEKII